MAGPKRKPTNIHILHGNPGKRDLPTNEPRPPKADNLYAPTYLTDVNALAEWRRVVPVLDKLGLITAVDKTALANYCMAFAKVMAAEKEIEEDGITVKGRTGPIKNPAFTVWDASMKQMRAYANEFGLTPAARPKLSIKDRTNGSTDPWAKKR